MGYTKGPWKVRGLDVICGRQLICNCDERGLTAEEIISNSRLISAAPDLLEACLMYRDMLTPAQECCDAMDSAIKKALVE
jgi:hypothetical protein